MGLTKLLIAGVGPFENTTLDFSDGNGKPHMGPHIIAGVNGCGKSTVLRAIAATASGPGADSFPMDWWNHHVWDASESAVFGWWSSGQSDDRKEIIGWLGGPPPVLPRLHALGEEKERNGVFVHEGWNRHVMYLDGVRKNRDLVTGYAPSLTLRQLNSREFGGASARDQGLSLGFENAANGGAVLQLLKDLRLSASHAQVIHEDANSYLATLRQIERALSKIMGEDVLIEVKPGIEPTLLLRLGGRRLNLSQLPDGARNLLGWFVDFVRRRETFEWPKEFESRRPTVLLVDEIDAHLHPKWQRVILSALQDAFTDQEVQIIVTTHSPFVISSCPDARVHVLDVDEEGHSKAREPVAAPVGQSVAATIKDVFGVDSRFDVETERELNRWNEYRRAMEANTLDESGKRAFAELTAKLSEKSEELRLLVGDLPRLPEGILRNLLRG